MMVLLAASYPLGRLLAHVLPYEASRLMIVFGSYWLAFMYYLLIFLVAIDMVGLIAKWTGIMPTADRIKTVAGWAVIIVVTAIVIYGAWNANHPVVKTYEVTLNQKSSKLDSLQVVAVSDIHLGWINGIEKTKLMTDMINDLNPDLVLLPGDVIDEGIDLSTERKIPQLLQALHPRLGTYAIMGNHEYISGNADKVEAYLKRAGITVLRDECRKFEGFYLIGRDNQSRRLYNGSPRQDLDTIMKDVQTEDLPVILMDHEPSKLQESEQAGIDLQVSGHTHKGQIWPNHYITRAIFEQDWGYLRKGDLQVIVSCGYGTWGPPIRVGNRPEILDIRIKFEPATKG